jgi:CubicO group peptidase (beta-lactamase class C family)
MRNRLAGVLLALTLSPLAAGAQQAPPPQTAPTPVPFTGARARAIEAIVQGELRSGSTPGIAIGVVEDGLLVYARGFGYANLESRRRVGAATEFYAGGLSKQFTAASILLLAQDKKLSLDDRVTKYVPELSIARNVTIAQLLRQTSGLPDYTNAPGIAHDPSKPVKIGDLLKAVNRMPLAAQPGTAYQYNNFNYIVAALIVERASEVPLSVFFQTHIFEPLIMTSTFLAGDQGISPLRAFGYTRSGGKFARAARWDASWLLGTGDLVTNVYDMAKWDIGMPLLLNVDSVREMWSTSNVKGAQYGMGWNVDQRGGQRFLWNNGEIAGFHAMNALLPDRHVAVIVLANADSLHGQDTVSPERLANRVLDVVAPLPPAHFAGVVTQRATEWLGRLQRLDVDRTQLTPDFSQFLSDRVVIRADLKGLGPVVSIVPIESFQRSGDTVYVFAVKFRHGAFRYQFALAPDGKIDGLLLQP